MTKGLRRVHTFPSRHQLGRLLLDRTNRTSPVAQTRKEKEKEISDVKPKIEGARKYPGRAAGPTKKEFSTTVLGLESHTFDIGNTKYAAKYKKTVDSIANYIQREYKDRANIAKAIKELSLPSLQIPGFPKARTGETVVDPGDMYLWQQDAAAVKKQIVQLEEIKKSAYALVIRQCSPDLDSKL